MIRVSAFAAIASIIGCASAKAPAPTTAPQHTQPTASSPDLNLYARIPSEIGAFKLTERTTVRGLPTDSLFRFKDGSRTNLSVIIYDVGTDVQVDADSQKWTRREGEKFRVVQDILMQRGQIGAYTVAYSDTTRFGVGERSFLEHSIATPVRYRNGAIVVDMQYIYLISGKFVKVRATIPEQGWQQTQVPTFARALAVRLAGK